MSGPFNSSVTRVRPVFKALFERDPSGESWLPGVLELCPEGHRVPAGVRAAPGRLLSGLLTTRPYGWVELEQCFERGVPPPEPFLRWLIDNSKRLTWPRNPGKGAETLRWRRQLCGHQPALREAARDEARRLLAECGAARSRWQWWAFEGFTEVDCWLETEQIVLAVEGKRRDILSAATACYPARNQLVRNLEVVGHQANGKAAFVMLGLEQPTVELTPEAVAESTPHLSDLERQQLLERYLGQLTWRQIVDRFELPLELLD